MLLNVAFEVSNRSDVLKLGVNGLDMQINEVETSLQNNKDDIRMAMYDVLKKWKNTQGDRRAAYTVLSNALKAVKMNEIEKVLDKA